jgi:hypothetical protein
MLITDEYRQEQQKLHERADYGVASLQFAPMVVSMINATGARTLLDYGAGKCRLATYLREHAKALKHDVEVSNYDPGIPAIAERPEPAELVTCIDVLEHIEPHLLDDVLNDLKRVTQFYGFFTVHTGPAVKLLSDGRNAHLIQERPLWWLPKFGERFDLLNYQKTGTGFYVVVRNGDL